MNKKLLLLFPVLLGLTFCSTTPSSDNSTNQTDISVSIDHDVIILENIRLLVEDGSLSSLSQALFLLETENVGESEQGEYLKFVAGSLLKLVFPFSEESNTRIINPKSGMQAEIVKKAGEGEILEIPNKDVSFFTLLLSSTAALYTNSEAVMERSIEILETIYSSDSKSYLLIYIRSFLFEKQHLYNQAFVGYSESLKNDPFSYPSEMGAIRILIRNGEYKKALKHIENIQSKYNDYVELSYLVIDSFIGNNDLEKAFVLISDLLSENPDDIVLTLKYADILQKQGQNSRAVNILNSIEATNGVSLLSVRIRASILVNEGEYVEALGFLKKAMENYQEDPELRNLYGNILLLTGKEGEGREYLENSLLLNPDSLESLRLLTEEAITSESWIRAVEFIEELLEKEGSDKYLRYAVEIYYNLGNNIKAIEYNLKIINNGKPLHLDYYNYVDMFLADGKTSLVTENVDKWIKKSNSSIDKSYFYYLKSLALVDPYAKLDVLRQALFENLQNLEAIIAISDAYYNLDEKRNSYRYLKQALILVPGDEFIKEKIRKLEREL